MTTSSMELYGLESKATATVSIPLVFELGSLEFLSFFFL